MSEVETPEAAVMPHPGPHPTELRTPSTGAAWPGSAVASNHRAMRVRLEPHEAGALPTWQRGTPVDCTVAVGERTYYGVATVARQVGHRVWLRLPPQALNADRRVAPRREGGFVVRFGTGAWEWCGACADISETGMCLEATEVARVRETVDLLFRLPGDTEYSRARGTVVWQGPGRRPGRTRVGIAFEAVTLDSADRIARFCREDPAD